MARRLGVSRQSVHLLQPGNYNTDTLVQVLAELRRFLAAEKATLLWDGLPAHRSRAMQAWLNTQRHWLVVERLPAYAPELNTLAEVADATEQGIQRVCKSEDLVVGFLPIPACPLDP